MASSYHTYYKTEQAHVLTTDASTAYQGLLHNNGSWGYGNSNKQLALQQMDRPDGYQLRACHRYTLADRKKKESLHLKIYGFLSPGQLTLIYPEEKESGLKVQKV